MNPIIRATLAVIAGIVIGGLVNMMLITVGSDINPAPSSVDVNDIESMRAGLHLFEPKHFLFPFLAHAGGTFVGALVAALLVATAQARAAFIVGGFYLIMGVIACFMIPAPAWFIAADLVFAYLPMGWLAGFLALKIRPEAD